MRLAKLERILLLIAAWGPHMGIPPSRLRALYDGLADSPVGGAFEQRSDGAAKIALELLDYMNGTIPRPDYLDKLGVLI